MNVVRDGPEMSQEAMPPEAYPPPAEPPQPPPIMPKIKCPECEFTFIVGEIAVATCPMCSAAVPTGFEDESE